MSYGVAPHSLVTISGLQKSLVSRENQDLPQPGHLSFVVSYPLNYKKNKVGIKGSAKDAKGALKRLPPGKGNTRVHGSHRPKQKRPEGLPLAQKEARDFAPLAVEIIPST